MILAFSVIKGSISSCAFFSFHSRIKISACTGSGILENIRINLRSAPPRCLPIYIYTAAFVLISVIKIRSIFFLYNLIDKDQALFVTNYQSCQYTQCNKKFYKEFHTYRLKKCFNSKNRNGQK